jgi:hypothetical protein
MNSLWNGDVPKALKVKRSNPQIRQILKDDEVNKLDLVCFETTTSGISYVDKF